MRNGVASAKRVRSGETKQKETLRVERERPDCLHKMIDVLLLDDGGRGTSMGEDLGTKCNKNVTVHE